MRIDKMVGALLFAAALGQFFPARAADVNRYLVAKGQEFQQTNATAVVLSPTSTPGPFRFVAAADAAATDSVLFASVRVPGAVTNTVISPDELGNYEFDTGFITKALLDTKYPIGNYVWTFTNLNDGVVKATNVLTAEVAPGTPKVALWDELQEVEATQPLDFFWSGFTNGTANDFVRVEISDTNDTPVVGSPAFLDNGALNGTNTTWQLPGGWLEDGTPYFGTVMFVKRTALNTTGYPGANGVAGYFRVTKFPLMTLPAPASPNGRIQFSTRKYSAGEADGQANILVTRSGDNSGPVSVDFSATDGTARDGTDYFGGTTTLNFADGESSQVVPVSIIDNFLLDSNRTVNLALANPGGSAELGSRTSAVLTILDNEIAAAGKLQFATRSNSVAEAVAGHIATVTVTRTGGSTGTVSVDFFTADDTAFDGQNYTATNGTLVFSNGIVSKNIVVPIINDSFFESNEVFTVNLQNPQGGVALGTNLTTKVGIVNDDFPGTFALKQSTYSVNENDGSVTVNVIRTGGAADGVTVDLFTQDGTAQDGVRYNGIFSTLSFAGGETNKAVAIGVINDLIPNGNQNFFVLLTNVTGGAKISTNAAQKMATVTVLDDESSVAFSNATYTVSEAGGTLTATVVRTGALLTQVGVSFGTADISATAGLDYRATNGTLVFPPNVKSKTFTVNITNDTIVEGDEQFQLQLFNPTNGVQLGAQSNAIVTITDNDFGGTISFTATNFVVSEAGTNAAITLVRSNGLASGVMVDLTITDGTALDGVDYSNVSQTVTFNAGETSKKILVPVFNNTIVDGTRVAQLALGNFQGGGNPGTRTLATLTITNNDVGGVISFTRTNFSGFESGTNIYASVSRTGGKASGVSVDYFTQDGTALDGVRYFATNGTVTFAANETNKIIAVGLINDTLPNGNQSFFLRLANPAGGATLGSMSNATLTVLDDESSVAFSSPAYAVDETLTTVTITVQRTGTLTVPANVNYSATAQSAQDHVNFIATNSGVVSFPVNVTNKTFTVPILHDTRVTGPLTFGLQLFSPTGGARLGAQDSAQVTIADKDSAGRIGFLASSFNVTNTGTNAIITVTRVGGLASGVSADFSTADGSAQDGVDYTRTFPTVTFNAGETNKKVSVPITKKTVIDVNKTVLLALQNPQGGAAITNGNATLNILENRSSIGLTSDVYTANKAVSNVVVTLVRGGSLLGTVSVAYLTANGTATNPADYHTASGTASFGPGVTSKNISVPIVNNHARSGDTTFSFRIGTPVGCILAAPTNATVNIIDPLASPNSIFNFSAPVFSVNKTNGNAIVTVSRIGGLANAATVDLNTADGTATLQATDPYNGFYFDQTGQGDYLTVGTTVNFPAGVSSTNVLIPVLNNPIGGIRPVDGGSNRWFNCQLLNPQGSGGASLGSTTVARVDILDTLKHGMVQFGPTNYVGSTNVGSVSLTITRTNGSDGIVVVYFNPFKNGDTAFPNVDYDVFAGNTFNNNILFSPGETNKVITMALFPTSGAYPKTSHPVLNTPQFLFGATFGPRTNAVLTITP